MSLKPLNPRKEHLSVQEALAFRTDLATGTWDRLTKEKFEAPREPQVPDLKCPCQNFNFGRRILWTGLKFWCGLRVFLLSIALLFPKTPLLVDKDIDSLDNHASRSEKDQHQALVSNHCNCWFMFWFWNSLQWFFHNAHKKNPTQFRTNNPNQLLTSFGVFLSTYPWLPKGNTMKITVVSFTWMAGAKGKSGHARRDWGCQSPKSCGSFCYWPEAKAHLQKKWNGCVGFVDGYIGDYSPPPSPTPSPKAATPTAKCSAKSKAMPSSSKVAEVCTSESEGWCKSESEGWCKSER